jgi:peptidoglycan/xylan/chitin deacetylase (PgdA/CDA1 family)
MSPLSSCALNLYCQATRPWRAWYGRQATALGRLPLTAIFYHRVADDRANSWTISPRGFLQHLDWLQEHCELVGLDELQRRLRTQDSRRPATSITFDDGYAENCQTAIPLLVQRKIPCTYFVTVGNVIRGERFPHDLANGHSFAPNTVEQLRAMAAAGIEIGVHGYTHCSMGAIADPIHLEQEILVAKSALEDLVGRPMRYFSFPFGFPTHISPAALEMTWRAGYEGVCSACGGYNLPGRDRFLLARIHGEDGLARLRNWVTVDPRKLQRRWIDWEPPQDEAKTRETQPACGVD